MIPTALGRSFPMSTGINKNTAVVSISPQHKTTDSDCWSRWWTKWPSSSSARTVYRPRRGSAAVAALEKALVRAGEEAVESSALVVIEEVKNGWKRRKWWWAPIGYSIKNKKAIVFVFAFVASLFNLIYNL